MSKAKVIETLEETIDEIYLSLKYSFKDITVFPGEPLKVPLMISASITLISLLCWLFNIPRFTNWGGALLGTVVLAVLYFIGKEDKDGESESIRISEDGTESPSGREESASEKGSTSGREEFAKLLGDSIPFDTEDDINY